MDSRRLQECAFKGLTAAAALLILLVLILLLGAIALKGLPALNLSMLTRTPEGGYYLGKEGGILNAIVGSLSLAGGATLLALVLSLPIVFYLNVYARKRSRLASFTRFSLDVLWGVPSIVYGAFGFMIMIFFGLKASLLGGIIAVTLLLLPIMSRAMDEIVRMVPEELFEASYALGSTRLETASRVIVRQALPGILTAVLISFGRGIGDAASVLFTAGFADSVPTSITQPVATLPLAVFFQLATPFPEVRARAYASALVLTLMVLVISVASRALAKGFMRNVVR